MQAIAEKRINSLAICLPPRSGKSYTVSLYCAWLLGNYPTESVMRNTCTATLYDKFSYDTRAIILSMKYREVFPQVYLSENKKNLDGWNLTTSRQVGYFGAGVGGTIIGFGATRVAITDDLYKSMKDANSPGTNRTVEQWKESAHDSRLEKDCATIDIGTRWTVRDIIGKNIEAKHYDKVIIVQALIQDPKTKEEVSFCEDVKTTEQFKKIRARVDRSIWNAEYMQQPVEVEGLLFKKHELKYFRLAELKREDRTSCLGYIDPADEGTDFFSFAVGDIFPKKIFISAVIFTQDNNEIAEPRTVGLIKDQQIWRKNNVTNRPELIKDIAYVRVEANNPMLFKNLRTKLGASKILGVKNTTNKHARILDASGFIKEYCQFLDPRDYAEGSDYDKFMRNLLAYMKDGSADHDDAPDTLTGLVNFVRSYLPQLFS